MEENQPWEPAYPLNEGASAAGTAEGPVGMLEQAAARATVMAAMTRRTVFISGFLGLDV
jgi:hypothetical protein